MATWAGQNVGAEKFDRVRQGALTASLLGFAYSLAAFLVLLFGGKYIALLFLDPGETEIIGQVSQFLIGNSMFYIPLTLVNVLRFAIQGMGFSGFAILAGVCEMFARTFVGFFPCTGLWFSSSLLCQPSGVDLRGSVFGSGVLSLLEAAEDRGGIEKWRRSIEKQKRNKKRRRNKKTEAE